MTHKSLNPIVPTLLALLLAACVGARKEEPIEVLAPRARATPVFAGKDGKVVAWGELVEAAANADAVILGENHGHPLGLAFAAELWKDVLAKGGSAALSLEFFERDDQSRIDDYRTGVSDEATFRTRTGRTAGNYPAGHRAMVESAKAASRPVIGANAPRAYVRLVRLDSLDALSRLTPEQRRLVRAPDDLATGRYRTDFDKVMKPGIEGHGDESPDPAKIQARLDAAFRSQQTWDWTMADSIANALAAGARPVVHVVGRFHMDFDGGLVQALRRLRPGVKVITISFVDTDATALGDADLGRGDFVIFVGPEPKR